MEWYYIIHEESWFPGKITTNAAKKPFFFFFLFLKFNEEQRISWIPDCREIVQPQLIHYILMGEVKQLNPKEIWFKVAGRYIRFSLPKFWFKYIGKDVRNKLENVPSRINDTYFGEFKFVINEYVRNVFLWSNKQRWFRCY